MTLRVGVIGTGVMGADHVRTLREDTSGAALVAVCDADAARAQAVIIASPDATDAELAVAARAFWHAILASVDSRPGHFIPCTAKVPARSDDLRTGAFERMVCGCGDEDKRALIPARFRHADCATCAIHDGPARSC